MQVVVPPATTAGCVAIAIRRPAERVWSVKELAQRGIFRRTRPSAAPDPIEEELLRLLASAEYEAFMSLAVRLPQEYPGVRADRIGEDHVDQSADPRNSAPRSV